MDDKELLRIIDLFVKNRGYSIDKSHIAKDSLVELVNNGSMTVREINTIRFDWDSSSIVDQKSDLIDLTPEFINNYWHVVDGKCSWYEKLYLDNLNPLFPVFIDTRFIQMIKSDPMYDLHWYGYRGVICSKEEMCSQIDFFIKNICWGYDIKRDIPVLSIFLDDLLSLGEIEKGMIHPFVIDNKDGHLMVCNQNISNLIYGVSYSEEEISIYDTISKGFEIVNEIFEKKCGIRPFKRSSSSSGLRSILYPTKRNYEDYISNLAVLFVDNIDEHEIKGYLWYRIDELKETEVGANYVSNNPDIFISKTEFNKIRSISSFELLLELMNNPRGPFIVKKMKELWNERSKIHHTSTDDEYDEVYYQKQDEWSYSLYQVLFSIIIYLDSAGDICSQYGYSSQYGPHGHITNLCGFNRPIMFGERYAVKNGPVMDY